MSLKALKPSLKNIIPTIVFGLVFYYVRKKLFAVVCNICPIESFPPVPKNCIYNKFILFSTCKCDCYTLWNVINNYLEIVIAIVVFYIVYSTVFDFVRNRK